MVGSSGHVRNGSKAQFKDRHFEVRFAPESGHGSRFFMTSAANPRATLQHHHKGDGHEYSKSNNHDADWIIRGHFEHGPAR
jgi:hypothetical protein